MYADLANALSQLILGQPYDPSSTLPEQARINHLVDLARSYGMGDIDLPMLQAEFRGTGFDVSAWAAETFAD